MDDCVTICTLRGDQCHVTIDAGIHEGKHCWHRGLVCFMAASEFQEGPISPDKACCFCGEVVKEPEHGDKLPGGYVKDYADAP